MPSTYTSRLRLTLPATGELINTWGTTVNTGITELVDASIAGAATISTWGGAGIAYTLSNNNGVADEARCMFIVASGAPGENKNIICPAVSKLYVVVNSVTGGYTVTLKTAAGTGITVENGKTAILRCDGTNVVDAITQLPAFVVAGGTTNGVVYLNASKVLTTGSALTFDGTNFATTGNVTLGDASTDTVRVNGYMGVGGAGASSTGLLVSSSALTSSGQAGIGSNVTFNSSATVNGISVYAKGSTAAASFTLANGFSYYADNFTKGAGSTITNQHGVYIADQTQGTNNYGITSLVSSGTNKWNIYASGTAANYFAGSVGIGTSSPGAKLNVEGAGPIQALLRTTVASSYTSLRLYNDQNATGRALELDYAGSTYSGALLTGGPTGEQASIGTTGAYPLVFGTNNTARAVLDSSGNLGLGVTPSAWSGTTSVFQNPSGAIYSFSGNSQNGINSNAYYNGTNWIYRNSTPASDYFLQNGQHVWRVAPSGTAGNTISFTQAMTLDASGNLLVGTTSPPAYGSKLRVEGGIESFSSQFNVSSGTSTQFELVNRSASAGFDFYVNSGGTLAARITSGGDLLVGTTTYQNKRVTIDGGSSGGVWASCSTSANSVNVTYNSATTGDNVFEQFYTDGGPNLRGSIDYNRAGGQVRYNTTSDYRLKTFVAKVTGSGQRIDALNPVEFEWKENGNRARGFFAHEFQQVYASSVSGEKDAVDAEGKPVYQAMQASTSEVIADLVAEIQSLRARVAALEAA